MGWREKRDEKKPYKKCPYKPIYCDIDGERKACLFLGAVKNEPGKFRVLTFESDEIVSIVVDDTQMRTHFSEKIVRITRFLEEHRSEYPDIHVAFATIFAAEFPEFQTEEYDLQQVTSEFWSDFFIHWEIGINGEGIEEI